MREFQHRPFLGPGKFWPKDASASQERASRAWFSLGVALNGKFKIERPAGVLPAAGAGPVARAAGEPTRVRL
jgi:hypothetical protein